MGTTLILGSRRRAATPKLLDYLAIPAITPIGWSLRAGNRCLGPSGDRPLQHPVDVAGGDDANQAAVIDDQRASFAAASLGEVEQVGGRVARADLGHRSTGQMISLIRVVARAFGATFLQRGQRQEPAQLASCVLGWKSRVPRGQDVAVQAHPRP